MSVSSPAVANPALIQNDIVLFGLIAATLGIIFWTSSRDTGVFKKFYTYVPALLLCYFIPGIYNSIGLIDGNASKLYNPVASRVLLPAALVLLTLTIVQRIIAATTIRQVEIQYDHRVETTGYIKAFFAAHSVDVLNVDFHSENSKNERAYTSIYTVRMSARVNLVDLFGPLSEYEHVRAFRIRQPQ